ncbi:DUF4272 domain-containing protein [Rubritalea spongiae]|uniref:DUF4272 domain-containing protein n=1 Tax=Rubritalea spongiae TaxID=430797 RepID=A0ABW5E2X5_9BACT
MKRLVPVFFAFSSVFAHSDEVGDSDPSSIESRKEYIEKLTHDAPSEEALARKQKSIAFLKGKGVPTIEHLPVVADSKSMKPRTTKEIAERLVACTLAAVGGETGDAKLMAQLVTEYKAEDLLSPDEADFIKNGLGDQQQRTQFSWRYERAWVLLWALGLIDDLEYPTNICDVSKIVGIIRDNSLDSLIEKAKPRSKTELLDAKDLIYRLHWATTEERVNKTFELPAELERGVVWERHAALNWLIGYMGQSWDEITTDT